MNILLHKSLLDEGRRQSQTNQNKQKKIQNIITFQAITSRDIALVHGKQKQAEARQNFFLLVYDWSLPKNLAF